MVLFCIYESHFARDEIMTVKCINCVRICLQVSNTKKESPTEVRTGERVIELRSVLERD